MKPTITAKLTKRFLMSLKEGQYVVSNCYNLVAPRRYETVFRETVAPLEAREAQWARVKVAYANGRNCDVLASESDYGAYIKSLPVPRE